MYECSLPLRSRYEDMPMMLERSEERVMGTMVLVKLVPILEHESEA